MKRLLKIDKGIYEADDNTKTYRFLKRNPEWELTGKTENEHNKSSLNGYKRIFRNGKEKIFKY